MANARSKCRHTKGFTFKQTKVGVKRTCRQKCGFSVTDVTTAYQSILDIPWKKRKPKGQHRRDE